MGNFSKEWSEEGRMLCRMSRDNGPGLQGRESELREQNSDKIVLMFGCYCGGQPGQTDRLEELGPVPTLQCWISFGIKAAMAVAADSS